MRQLAIIPCGKKKIWDRYPDHKGEKVAEAYIGVLHRLTKQYAEMFCDQWVILSAKHGYSSPDEIIKSNYDLTFGMNETGLIISNEDLIAQIKQKNLSEFDQIIALTGKKHQKIINATFSREQKIIYPLLGTKGIGEMQQKLKGAIETKRSLHD